MIKDKLITHINANFPRADFSVGEPPDAVVVFPAKHASVGDVGVWDDGDELTVSIGEITHGHFGCYEPDLPEEEREQRVVEAVAAFLEDLFADRVLLYKARWGGGWEVLNDADGPPVLRKNQVYFVWSGPVGAGDSRCELQPVRE